mmetsp:Transcript_84068/g.238255  ORF Transcript_84068/g.238255 Transcript_84068/m.238255 type:complete len:221 (+) Transcript_84068:836-1498(+)
MKEVFVASPGSTPPRLLTHPSQPIAPTKINRPLPTNKLSLGLTNVEMLLKAGVEEEELADFLGLHLGAINSRGSIAGRGSISGWAGAKKRKMSLVGVEMSHSAERRGSRRASTKVNGKETTAKRSVGFKDSKVSPAPAEAPVGAATDTASTELGPPPSNPTDAIPSVQAGASSPSTQPALEAPNVLPPINTPAAAQGDMPAAAEGSAVDASHVGGSQPVG